MGAKRDRNPLKTSRHGAHPSSSKEQPSVGQKVAGRRQNPDYTQVAAYIPEALYKKVKVKLIQEENARNFSELMEDLLVAYVAN